MNRVASLAIAVALLLSPVLCAQTLLNAQIAEASARIEQLSRMHAGALNQARAWRSAAALQQDAARYDQSAASFAQAIQLFQSGPEGHLELAEAIDGRGTLEVEMGEFAAARASLSQARAMRVADKDSLGVARSDVHLANLYLGEHDYEEAHALAAEALASFDHDPHADALDQSAARIAVSLALCKLDRSRDALPILENLVALSRRSYPDDSAPVGLAFYLLGYAEQKNHDLPLADAYIQRGIQDMENSMGWGHPVFVEALRQYAGLLRETGRAGEAQQVEARVNQLRSRARAQGMDGVLDRASLP